MGRERPRTTTRVRSLLVVFAILWIVGVVLGMRALFNHSETPGEGGQAPKTWPSGAAFARDGGRPTLVMLAHPRCPCTRASLAELSLLMTRAHGRVKAHVLFVEPTGAEPGFANGSLWERAASIPGVEAHLDPKGRTADLFGAKTSGQVVLYARDGKLLFSGGITRSRGHEGDNVGLERVLSLVQGKTVESAESSVFGCELFDQEDES